MTDSARSGVRVVAETTLVGLALGTLMGLIWWWVAPTEVWRVAEGGALLPSEIGFNAWFAADGWFLVLGGIFGVLLTLLSWRRGRGYPVALVLGVVVGGTLLAFIAWSLGGVLGPPDPKTVAATAEIGASVDGALGLRALGVMCAPLLTALTTLALLVASAKVETSGAQARSPIDPAGVPQQPW